MNSFKRVAYISITAVLLLYLIVYSNEIVLSAQAGIQLCIHVVIPSLFPFICIMSYICNQSSNIQATGSALSKMIGIPPQTQYILASAFLGGYPIGAQSVAIAYKNKQISKECAQRLLAFCNNAGPSFIFGLIGTMFTNKLAPLALWIIHIFTALFIGTILPGKEFENTKYLKRKTDTTTDILKCAITSMSIICGWIILFRVVITAVSQMLITRLSITFEVLITGLLELSNGCAMLIHIGNEALRFIIASIMLSAGGICVLLQTKSVVGDISLRKYLLGKAIQTALSLTIAIIVSSILY